MIAPMSDGPIIVAEHYDDEDMLLLTSGLFACYVIAKINAAGNTNWNYDQNPRTYMGSSQLCREQQPA
jgi:hypothetical protein